MSFLSSPRHQGLAKGANHYVSSTCLCLVETQVLVIFGLPWWLSSKESTCNVETSGDKSSIPGLGRSPGGGHGNLLPYSYLENPMDRGAWQTAVHRVTQSWTQLKQLSPQTRQLFRISLSFLFLCFLSSSISYLWHLPLPEWKIGTWAFWMCCTELYRGSCSVVSDPLRPRGL